MPLNLNSPRVLPVLVATCSRMPGRRLQIRAAAAASSPGDARAGGSRLTGACAQLGYLRRDDQEPPLLDHAAAGGRQPRQDLRKVWSDVVKAGQVLMRIDPLKQLATVQSQQGTQAQKKALYDYNKIEVDRQRKLFEAGVVSRDTYEQASQAYENSKADYESNRSPHRHPEAAACLLRYPRAVQRHRRRHPSSPRRLRLPHHPPHDGR